MERKAIPNNQGTEKNKKYNYEMGNFVISFSIIGMQ